MKKQIALLALLMLFAGGACAAEFQGKVIRIEGDRVTIEIFGDGGFPAKVGKFVRFKTLPENLPTLDMLQG